MTTEQFMFLMAIDEFKKANEKTFPRGRTCSDRPTAGVSQDHAQRTQPEAGRGLREPANAPANVRPKGWERLRAA